jgi:hypothetical protein
VGKEDCVFPAARELCCCSVIGFGSLMLVQLNGLISFPTVWLSGGLEFIIKKVLGI